MPQLEDGVRHGFLSIKDPYFLHSVGGGKNPWGSGGLWACALRPKGVEFGFLASFFSTFLNKKKKRIEEVADREASLIKKEYYKLIV